MWGYIPLKLIHWGPCSTSNQWCNNVHAGSRKCFEECINRASLLWRRYRVQFDNSRAGHTERCAVGGLQLVKPCFSAFNVNSIATKLLKARPLKLCSQFFKSLLLINPDDFFLIQLWNAVRQRNQKHKRRKIWGITPPLLPLSIVWRGTFRVEDALTNSHRKKKPVQRLICDILWTLPSHNKTGRQIYGTWEMGE